ncbi:hypothetical protein BDY21DRAFT_277722 [Lineolata rhizophorae]|uniref:Adenine deaminase n=1 Tax=Lineolata rhizophorae TaxID=578093 RepID=A0A6A6PDE4_9PEZI|nr:hypothetical protein BDY21DRAFT_277722 [Lineolata rhizophorae]
MCKSPFHPLLQALPKCEHHMHIEGALSPDLLFDLASRNDVSLPGNDESFASPSALHNRYKRFTSLDDFLQYYYIGMSVLINESDFEDLAWDYFQKAASGGLAHAELFFDPQAHSGRGVGVSTVVRGFDAARRRAEEELGVSSLLTPCFLRHLPAEDSLSAFRDPVLQQYFASGSLIGVGLDSSEADNPPKLWRAIFEEAGKLGLKKTAHAGEEGPPEYVSEALEELQVDRIDHGVTLARNPTIMKEVARKGVMLSLCPKSNVVLRCVQNIQQVPIRTYLDAGVNFSINSDDPAYFGGYILDNFCEVHEAFDLSLEEWTHICKTAIEGSWCGRARKDELLHKLEKVLKDWNAQN